MSKMRARARWLVKKVGRQSVALASWASGSLLTRRLAGKVALGPSVRVLMYHRFGREREDAFCVTPEDFEAHMRWLADRKLAVSLDQVRRFVAGREELPDGACLVTMDDGCLTTLTEALPALRRCGVPAVAYVTPGLVGAKFTGVPGRYLTWDELRELAASDLFTIGAHGNTHRSLGLMSDADARDEATRCKQTIEDQLGRSVRSFAYPFGTRADFHPRTERALADAGFEIAFNSMHGPVRPGMDPISLPRVKIEGGEGRWMFELASQGGMDAWRLVDRSLSGLQRVRTEGI